MQNNGTIADKLNGHGQSLPCVATLRNVAQHYAWGNTGGIVPFIESDASDTPYPVAAVGLGSHRAAPSLVLMGNEKHALNTLIQGNPSHWLGVSVAGRYHDLPFLFKVLSAGSPLSLQVHPTLLEARVGFARETNAGIPLSAPERSFKDTNHKPELAVALTPFRAMAGFRTPAEIATLLGPELRGRFDFKGDQSSKALRSLSKAIFSLGRNEYSEIEAALTTRATALCQSELPKEREAGELALELQQQYPHDPGQFGPLLLRILDLAPGAGLFVPAGVIHAYIKGSILEIMACSDNVIRAGLTIKHVDASLLCDILKPGVEPVLIQPRTERSAWGSRTVYITPAKEFRLERLEVDAGSAAVPQYSPDGPEILLCTEGRFVIRADTDLELGARASCLVAGSCATVSIEGAGTLWRASWNADKEYE